MVHSRMTDPADTRLPICLLSGFLGAGKSTMLNFVLQHPRMNGTAVVINEFGSVGVDHHLVESSPDDTELIADGCICCTASGQLAEALMSLFQRAQRRHFTLRRVILETTGLAEPGPVLRQLLSHPLLQQRFVVDSVVTLVDAVNGANTFRSQDIAVQQITGADRLILTKTDLVSEAEAAKLEQALAQMNPDAVIERVLQGAASPEQLFSGGQRLAASGQDLGSLFQRADQFRFTPLATDAGPMVAPRTASPADQDIQTFSLILDEPIPPSTFFGWIDFLRSLCGPTLLRMKGLVNLQGHSVPTVVHGVQSVFHRASQLPAWPSDDHRTRLVFITRGSGQEVVGSTMAWLESRVGQPVTRSTE